MVQIQTHYPSFSLLQEPKALWDERNFFLGYLYCGRTSLKSRTSAYLDLFILSYTVSYFCSLIVFVRWKAHYRFVFRTVIFSRGTNKAIIVNRKRGAIPRRRQVKNCRYGMISYLSRTCCIVVTGCRNCKRRFRKMVIWCVTTFFSTEKRSFLQGIVTLFPHRVHWNDLWKCAMVVCYSAW